MLSWVIKRVTKSLRILESSNSGHGILGISVNHTAIGPHYVPTKIMIKRPILLHEQHGVLNFCRAACSNRSSQMGGESNREYERFSTWHMLVSKLTTNIHGQTTQQKGRTAETPHVHLQIPRRCSPSVGD